MNPIRISKEFVNGIFIYKSINKTNMKKLSLLFLATVCSLITFGQDHKKGWDISVGPKLFAPLSGNVDWDSKSWGQKVEFSKKNLRFSAGFMQNKAGFVEGDSLLVDDYRAGVRGFKTSDDSQQCRLASSGGAYQHKRLQFFEGR